MYSFNQTSYLRLSQILGNRKTNPSTPPIIPVSKSTWWQGVKTGRFPKPVKLGPRITVWLAQDIFDFIAKNNQQKGGG
jgi:prophage regulatory protein